MENEKFQKQDFEADSTGMTFRLFEKISSFHSVPRLRQKLVKISFKDFESHVPAALEKDLVYLISGLNALLGLSLDPAEYPNLPRELGEYLRHCDSYGLTIQHFFSRSLKMWEEIRPKYQELSRAQLAGALRLHFPALHSESSDRFAGYLLIHSLARLIPPFPFHNSRKAFSLVSIRAQPDLPWNLASQPEDYLPTLQNHFPEIDWKQQCAERKVWFLGLRLLSQFSPKTASVLKNALAGVSHLSTSRVRSRRKLLHLVFFFEADVDLFKFNLHHYAKLAGTFYELFESNLSDYRQGYPGLSGFIDEEMRQGIKAAGD